MLRLNGVGCCPTSGKEPLCLPEMAQDGFWVASPEVGQGGPGFQVAAEPPVAKAQEELENLQESVNTAGAVKNLYSRDTAEF